MTVLDTASAKLERMAAALEDKAALNSVMARAGTNVVQEHFRLLSFSNRNKFGARSTFWARMRGNTRPESSGAEAVVVMPREVALRRFGGTVRPVRARALTLPRTREAYGKSARQFDGLRAIILPRRRGRLLGYLVRESGKKTEILFALVSAATIRPNAAVLPTDEALYTAIADDLRLYLERAGG